MSADEKRPLVKGVQNGQADNSPDSFKSTPIADEDQGVASAAEVAALKAELAELRRLVTQLADENLKICEHLGLTLDYDEPKGGDV